MNRQRKVLITITYNEMGIIIDTKAEELDLSAQPERKTGRWERLMMYLADLQLTYSPNWGANGCGDEKLYEFVTGLIEELEGWEDGGGA